MTQIDRFKEEQRMQTASSIKTVMIWTWYIINALLTGTYGLGIVIIAFQPTGKNVNPLSPTQAFGVGILALVCAVFCVSLTDGARFLWNSSSMADNTTTGQQYLAKGMKILSFAASLFMSFLALRFFFSWLGVAQLSGMESSYVTTVNILSFMLLAHLIAGFIYQELSPEEKKIRSLANARAESIDKIITRVKLSHKNAIAAADQYMERYQSEVDERLTRSILSEALRALNHGEIDELPDHIKPPSTRAGRLLEQNKRSGETEAEAHVNGTSGNV